MKKNFTAVFIIFSILLTLCSFQAFAFDESNCLMCHKHRGLSYIDKEGNLRLLYVTESIYQNSPHGLFSCRDCHVDINEVPHSQAQKVDRGSREVSA